MLNSIKDQIITATIKGMKEANEPINGMTHIAAWGGQLQCIFASAAEATASYNEGIAAGRELTILGTLVTFYVNHEVDELAKDLKAKGITRMQCRELMAEVIAIATNAVYPEVALSNVREINNLWFNGVSQITSEAMEASNMERRKAYDESTKRMDEEFQASCRRMDEEHEAAVKVMRERHAAAVARMRSMG